LKNIKSNTNLCAWTIKLKYIIEGRIVILAVLYETTLQDTPVTRTEALSLRKYAMKILKVWKIYFPTCHTHKGSDIFECSFLDHRCSGFDVCSVGCHSQFVPLHFKWLNIKVSKIGGIWLGMIYVSLIIFDTSQFYIWLNLLTK